MIKEQLESTLRARDATIATLSQKIEGVEAVNDRLSCVMKENEELQAAHGEESAARLSAQAEFEVRRGVHFLMFLGANVM